MNTNSNKYIITYSIGLVIVIASLLTLLAVQLKPKQNANVRIEKMQNILQSTGIQTSPKDAEVAFNKYIKKSIALNSDGTVDENIKNDDVFAIELESELKKDPSQRKYPMFIATLDNGDHTYIIPLRGKGLCGPLWGYVALKEDFNTVVGTQFGHKSETPGLGAEIAEQPFQKLFEGKQIYDTEGKLVSVRLKKGGAAPNDLHGVDAISGGTLTSDGVSDMLLNMLTIYEPYFKANKK